jgi:hypothetical protein
VVTGTEEATEKPGVWTCLLGDGYSAAVDSWTSLKELAIAEADSEISFHFPALDTPDVFRTFLIEAYAGSESYSRPYWTHSLPTADFIDSLWREQVPFNLGSSYGLALCHKSPHAWLTRPDGVWRAVLSPDSVELTSDVLHLTALARETSGEISITLRNDDGRYATPGMGDNAPIKLGSEIKFSPGYRSSEGIEVSAGPAYWITGWEHTSRGSKAAFILHAADGWGLLESWKARRQFTWQAGDRNIFQMLSWVFARAGLEFSALGGSSSAITDLEPAFTIMPGESGKTAVQRLLSMVEEVLFFRGNYGYLRYPQDSDATDYEYGADHSILEGEYSQQAKAINRAQVFGDEVFTEDWDWPEIELVLDILGQAQDLNLDTAASAHARGQVMLRDAEIHAGAGQITVPLNCGQELYDVVEITDQRAGLSAAKRRVLALQHTYAPSKGKYVLRIALGAV